MGDSVALAVCEKLRELEVAAAVVAGIVADGRVIAVASGTRWQPTGVRDAHAEVLARRAVIAVLQTTRLEGPCHLYVSAPPCGDAAICGSMFTGAKLGDWRVERDQLLNCARYKGARRDVRIRATSLSCTDKIIRWAVLGLEGAALRSRGIRCRLASVTSSGALDRLAQRADLYARELGLPEPRLHIHSTSITWPVAKVHDAVVWWEGCGHPDVIVQGRLQGSSSKNPKHSRLASHLLFADFHDLASLKAADPHSRALKTLMVRDANP